MSRLSAERRRGILIISELSNSPDLHTPQHDRRQKAITHTGNVWPPEEGTASSRKEGLYCVSLPSDSSPYISKVSAASTIRYCRHLYGTARSTTRSTHPTVEDLLVGLTSVPSVDRKLPVRTHLTGVDARHRPDLIIS